jgi:hypothetical protein
MQNCCVSLGVHRRQTGSIRHTLFIPASGCDRAARNAVGAEHTWPRLWQTPQCDSAPRLSISTLNCSAPVPDMPDQMVGICTVVCCQHLRPVATGHKSLKCAAVFVFEALGDSELLCIGLSCPGSFANVNHRCGIIQLPMVLSTAVQLQN